MVIILIVVIWISNVASLTTVNLVRYFRKVVFTISRDDRLLNRRGAPDKGEWLVVIHGPLRVPAITAKFFQLFFKFVLFCFL